MNVCPVCGYENLKNPPYAIDGSPSDEICPSCKFQFGYHDSVNLAMLKNSMENYSHEEREEVFKKWRENWIKTG